MKKVILILAILAVASFIAWVVTRSTTGAPFDETATPVPTATETTLQGKMVCLPHKDTSGPVTLECAFGIKTDAGDHYALDTTTYFPEEIYNLPMDERVAVSGVITPIEKLKEDRVSIYAIKGVLRVTGLERL